ncbi:unnamed protein product [Rhizophagus irregularis]|uniref:Secreted protein n=1 Tax=Rhizophagus irregularis TaxID=588596 RepID=A0A916E8W9_9GLOM|nr:unnamed protein product [Rhizophagus irregularis]CAB5368477.1 unnamed protein product [Rhizophagus irregularis]
MIVGARALGQKTFLSVFNSLILFIHSSFQFCRASDGTPDQKQRLASDIKKSTLPKDNSSPHSFGRHFL